MSSSTDIDEIAETQPQVSKFTKFYRGTFFQANVIGAVVFTQVGIYVGLLNLGAGGQATTHTVYVATSITNGLMTILAAPSALFANRFGLKLTLFIGTIGYTLYSTSLYYNSKTGDQVFMIVASVILGISGACLWMAEGAIVMSYPEKEFVGMFLGLWRTWYEFGSILAGAIVFSLNKDGKGKGSVSLKTYIVLFSVQCAGPFLTFLLSPPERVIRKDGTKIHLDNKYTPFKTMLKGMWGVLKRKEILCIIPICISNHWLGTWQSNFMTHNFSVRTRSLNVLVTALIGCVSDIGAGFFLDNMRWSYKFRSIIACSVLSLSLIGMFIWAFVVQTYIDKHDLETLDWSTGGYYYNTYVPFQIFKVPYELIYVWIYWVIRLFPFTSTELFYVSGVIRSFESLGGFLAYIVGVVNKDDMNNLIVSGVMYFVSIPFFNYVAICVTEENARLAHDMISTPQGDVTDLDDIKVIEGKPENNSDIIKDANSILKGY